MELPKKAKEIKIGLYLKYLDETLPKEKRDKVMLMLSCVAKVLGKEYFEHYKKLFPKLMYENIGNASRKDLAATTTVCFSANQARKIMRISPNTYRSNYTGLFKDDLELVNHLVNMKPIVAGYDNTVLEDTLIKFLEQFRVATENNSRLEINKYPRTYEIDFFFIFNKLTEVFNNDYVAREFIRLVCQSTEIDDTYPINMINFIYKIDRRYPVLVGSHAYFISEVYNLYSLRGYSKSYIGQRILGCSKNYFLTGSYKRFAKVPTEQDLAYQKSSVLSYPPIGLRNIKELINVFHNFIDCVNEISI